MNPENGRDTPLNVRKRITRISMVLYCLLLIATVILPLYLTFVTAFKTTKETYANYLGLPTIFSLENFTSIIEQKNIAQYFANSVYITAVSILLINLVTPLTAYIIARNHERRFFKYIYIYFLISIFVPFNVIVFPLTKLLYSLKLMNSIGLIICYVALSIPENIFLYVAYFRAINRELFEAAQLDGCGPFQYYARVLLPTCRTIVITVNILNIIWIWNDFFLPLMVVNTDPSSWTLPIFIYNFKGQHSFSVNLASAAYQISIIPIAILFIVFQNKIIEGTALQSKKL